MIYDTKTERFVSDLGDVSVDLRHPVSVAEGTVPFRVRNRPWRASMRSPTKIRVYDTNFNPVRTEDDAFDDYAVPHGFAPFNVQNIGGNLYVAYAQQLDFGQFLGEVSEQFRHVLA
jgi:hypothetical protein